MFSMKQYVNINEYRCDPYIMRIRDNWKYTIWEYPQMGVPPNHPF